MLGQGRVAGQAILKDVGRQMLSRTYDNMQANAASGPAPVAAATAVPAQHGAPLSPGLIAAFGVFAVGIGAVGYEIGRRENPERAESAGRKPSHDGAMAFASHT